MDKKFKNDFYWGVATSGPQTEGTSNRSMQVMDKLYDIASNRFFEGKNVLGNVEKRYVEYIDIASKIGINSYRTSIQWARLIPDGVNVSKEAVDFYRDYFLKLKEKGIEPFVNLMHFDMPMWAQEKGGWENKEIIDKYVEYAKTSFNLFGDIVKKWFTFNEPIVVVEGGYWFDWHYPNKVNMTSAMQVQFNSLIAHVKTVKAFKDGGYDGEIGIILNITPVIPRSDSEGDLTAAKWAELFQSKCYLDPIILGEYPNELILEGKKRNFIWDYSQEEMILIKNAPKIDFLGVNYYQPQRVKALDYMPNWDSPALTPEFYYNTYNMPGKRINPYRGWEIYPEALYMALKNIQTNYGNIKMFVSENGMGVENEGRFRNKDGIIEDNYRIDFLTEHIVQMHKAINEGANCVGYHMWTFVDNWSWMNAYKNRYGLIEFDITTGELKVKKSAQWFAELIKKNKID